MCDVCHNVDFQRHERSIMFETNVPIPAATYANRKYPFAQLQPGESVLYPCAPDDRRKVGKAAYRVANHHKWQFVVRSVPEGVRVWRI